MSRSCMHIDPLPSGIRSGRYTIRAKWSGHPHWRKRNGIVFFDLPEALAAEALACDQLDARHDLWLRAAIFPAMEAGHDLYIHGAVSRALLANLEIYQCMIADWWPEKYRVVGLRADQEIEGPAPSAATEAVLTFSGGLDSIFSLHAHQRQLRGRNSRHIAWCVLVHGYDIPLTDNAFDGAFVRAQQIVESLGSRLIPVRTNLRRHLPAWPESYATALAAALSLFAGRYAEGVVASSVNYRNDHLHEEGYGSSPSSDWLLSGHDFRIVHDLANASRAEKTHVLCDWEEARRNVRVCWSGADLSTNCGVCSKCVWQMLCLLANGIEDYRAFAEPLTTERVATMSIPSSVHRRDLEACLEYATRNGHGDRPELVALRQVLTASHDSATHARDSHSPRAARPKFLRRLLRSS